MAGKKPRFIDEWWVRILVLLFVPVVLEGISPELGSYASLGLLIALIVRVVRLRRQRNNQRATDLVRTKPKIQAEITDLCERIEFYSTYREQTNESGSDQGLVLQDNEHPIAVVSNVGLIEHRTTEGVSEPRLIDEGRFVVTDRRGVFIGSNETREFLWSKLVLHKQESLATALVLYLSVSNRQKVSGIAADPVSIEDVQQRVEFGVSVALERQAEFFDKLNKKIELLQDELGSAPSEA
jgi:hypothetical protein